MMGGENNMPNIFLNTARTVAATSNPQANIQQVSNNNIQQPVSSNVNSTNGVQPTQNQQNNGINPITIPIQIQPQIAQTGQPTQTNNQGIQTIANQNNLQQNQAPTPQQYQANNSNSNVVDFNQIYSSYKNNFGNNQNSSNNMGASGVRKTSVGTTIVTPITTNLNSVQGQYQSAYSDTINGVIGSMLSQLEDLRTGNFGYDPNEDIALQMASEYAANSTLQSLAGSGVLNSSATSERVARIVSELIPQYEEKAYNRQLQYLSQLADTAQVVMQFDSQQFSYWKDAKDREFQEKQLEYEKQQKTLENAWKRVDELGYVDNFASSILGVKVGTLSASAREAKEQREFELQKMREQLEIEKANEEALYKLKSELDLENSKQLAAYENDLAIKKNKELTEFESNLNLRNSKELAAYENNLDTQRSKELAQFESALNTQQSKELAEFENNLNIQKSKELAEFESSLNLKNNKELAAYESQLNREEKENDYKLERKTALANGLLNSTKTSSTSLSTYKDIINNRFAEYDDITKKYSVSDNVGLYNYLVTEYSSGRLSATDLANLAAMYNVTQPTDKDISIAERRKYLDSLEVE